jgi:hypothetical protein
MNLLNAKKIKNVATVFLMYSLIIMYNPLNNLKALENSSLIILLLTVMVLMILICAIKIDSDKDYFVTKMVGALILLFIVASNALLYGLNTIEFLGTTTPQGGDNSFLAIDQKLNPIFNLLDHYVFLTFKLIIDLAPILAIIALFLRAFLLKSFTKKQEINSITS